MAREELAVWLDTRQIRRQLGWLRRSGTGRRADISFEYAADWIAEPAAFSIDPSLNLVPGEQRRVDAELHGIFSDAAPDSWGRRILQRREALLARDEARPARTLDEWDLLVGVSDATRMGALRFARTSDGVFLDDQPLAVPPLATLRALETIARRLDADAQGSDAEVRMWLRRLVAPGASLGGARPKVTFVDANDSLWIAKFPAANDTRDMGAWEYVQTRLAGHAGIRVPAIKLLALGPRYHTFAAERFDRDGIHRRLFASAMTLLEERDHTSGGDYLGLAEAIERYGNPDRTRIAEDLAELFRRVVFNVVAGHRDDHLRNHGFLHDGAGWRLAPAFDVNPIPDKIEHELSFDGSAHVLDPDGVRATARYYRLGDAEARRIVDEVHSAVTRWREEARAAGLGRDEIDLMAAAYAV